MKIEEQAALMEKGEVIYVEGEARDLRERLASVGEFFICPMVGGKCKVTKAGRPSKSAMKWIVDELKEYDGTPIRFTGSVSNLRNYISKYNIANGTSFRVRTGTFQGAEIYSDCINDLASITQEQFDAEIARMNHRIDKLRERLVGSLALAQDEDEDEEDLTPDPSIFVTRAKYGNIVDEDEDDIV